MGAIDHTELVTDCDYDEDDPEYWRHLIEQEGPDEDDDDSDD